MAEAPPEARALAEAVLRHEMLGRATPAEMGERVDARLRGRLGGLIGSTGYAILVARAVRLARIEVPALECVTVVTGDAGADGSLPGIREFARACDEPDAAEAGLIAILAQVVGLLITFIGEDLALRLVRDAWPELAGDPVAPEEQV